MGFTAPWARRAVIGVNRRSSAGFFSGRGGGGGWGGLWWRGGGGLPPIDADFIAGQALPAEKRSAAQAAAVALSDRLVQEVRDADAVVIASGMVNFSLTSGLKTWFD